ncbi:MAG: DUF3240 family protein [Burkholderiales bacterium]
MHPRKLVVIVAESALEKVLTRELLALGAHGYTVSDVRGRGAHGEREAAWTEDRNVRIEVVCEEEVAQRIALHVKERYAEHYALVVYVLDVGVLRGEKF